MSGREGERKGGQVGETRGRERGLRLDKHRDKGEGARPEA